MSSERQRQIESLYEAAAALPPDRWPEFLATTCTDPVLREEVEWRLISVRGTGNTTARLPEQPAVESFTGRRLGPWRIVKPLGEGGMGAVYLAERDDDQYRKTVAIKLLRREAGGETLIRRLAEERQTLAGLDHPNIVRLLDGGATPEGLPYLVMDYVEGVMLDTFCQTHTLSLDDRLRLFLAICSAVQYAHQNLIVHCDLKPPNILVTADGLPKLLDFGIARLIKTQQENPAEGNPAATDRHLARMFTPDYASPEQLSAEPVTTATDIYALGLILYELSTNYAQQAHETESGIHLSKRLSGSIAALPGGDADLNAIALKALAWEPAQRYRSVEHLADDVRRYQRNLPVLAREQTLSYRALKFVRRNRAGVAAGAALLVTIVAGAAATVWQAHVAEMERARAERGFQDVRKLAHVLLFDFHDEVSKLPGSTPVEQLLVTQSLQYLDNVSKDASNPRDIDLRLDLAEGYMKMGDLQGNPYEQNLGDAVAAVATYRKGLAILGPFDPKTLPKIRLAAARLHRRLGEVLPSTGNLPAGVEQLRESVRIMEPLFASDPRNAESAMELASDNEILGDELGNPGLYSLGDTKAALASYQKALATWRTAAGLAPDEMRAQRAVATLLMKLGDLEYGMGQGTALERYRAALAVMDALPPGEQATVFHKRLESMLYRKEAEILAETDARSAAVSEAYGKALSITEALAAADPTNLRELHALGVVLASLGNVAEQTGDVAGAIRYHGRVADIQQRLLSADPANTGLRGRLAETLCTIGGLLERAGQNDEARRQTSRGIAMMTEIAQRADASAPEVERLASTLIRCHPASLQDPAAALRYAQRANTLSKGQDPATLDVLADAYERTGNRLASIETFHRALAILPDRSTPIRDRIEQKLAAYEKKK